MMTKSKITSPVSAWLLNALVLLAAPFLLAPVLAAEPAEFDIRYDATMGSWSAKSKRSLQYDTATKTWHMQAQSSVLLLGQSLTTITENASFLWQDDLPQPLEYRFDQSGIGSRTRSAHFDHVAKTVNFKVNDDTGQYPLTGPVYDDLSAYLVLRQQLQQGATDITFDVIDRGEIDTYHYRVIEETTLHTQLGDFPSVHLERVRDEVSKRRTEFWLAKNHDYLLLKLVQQEPNGTTLNLDVAEASLAGVALTPLAETHMHELE